MPANVALFRPAAVEELDTPPERLDVTPAWSWAIFALAAAIVVAALILGAVLPIEVTGRARGAVIPAGGIRAIDATATGIVAAVFHERGDRVTAGEPLLRIESAPARAGVIAADGALAAEELPVDDASVFARQRMALESRIAVAREQIDSARRSVMLREEGLRRRAALHDAGLASETDVSVERDAVESAGRQLSAARGELAATMQQLAALDEAHAARRRDLAARVAHVAAEARAAREPLRDLVVRAPVSGSVEALDARTGGVVQAGAAIGRIIPDGAALRIDCFLDQNDRRFVHPGDVAQLELDELPRMDFGTVPARVVRISRDLAPDGDVREVLGAERPGPAVYRVELEPAGRADLLHAGMLLRARFVLRHERPLVLLFAPLRRWVSAR